MIDTDLIITCEKHTQQIGQTSRNEECSIRACIESDNHLTAAVFRDQSFALSETTSFDSQVD